MLPAVEMNESNEYESRRTRTQVTTRLIFELPKVHGASSNNWPIRLASNQRPGQCYEADPKSWFPLIQEDIVGHRHRHGEIEPARELGQHEVSSTFFDNDL